MRSRFDSYICFDKFAETYFIRLTGNVKKCMTNANTIDYKNLNTWKQMDDLDTFCGLKFKSYASWLGVMIAMHYLN